MKNNNKTIYLHIGLPKTGTTSIQSFLYHNREELSTSGLFYPIIEESMKEKNASCANLRPILYKDMDKTKGIDPVFHRKNTLSMDLYKERFDAYFLNQIQEHENIVFSEEIMSGLPSSHYFVSMLKDYGYEVKVIAYVRPAAEWVAARWAEEVLNGVAYPLQTYINALPCLEEVKRIHFYSTFLGKENVIIKAYESCQWKNNSLIADFLDIFSIELSSKHKIVEPLHKTAGRNTTEIIRIMGHLGSISQEKQNKSLNLMKNQNTEDRKIIETLSDDEIFEITNKVNVYYNGLAEIYDKKCFFVNEYPSCYESQREEYEIITFNAEQANNFTNAIDEVRKDKTLFIDSLIMKNQQLTEEINNLKGIQVGQ